MKGKCEICQEVCPQAERARKTVKGRMYATNELLLLVKKIVSGRIVEVVRCEECVSFGVYECSGNGYCTHKDGLGNPEPDDFCSHGKRREEID